MDIRQIKFGEYSIGNPQGGAPRKSDKEASDTQTQTAQAQSAQDFNVDGMFNAMNIAGMQNMVVISKAEPSVVDPTKYLSEERIGEIEAMMAGFDDGVNDIANTIEAEFPGMFADVQKNALAATIYARE